MANSTYGVMPLAVFGSRSPGKVGSGFSGSGDAVVLVAMSSVPSGKSRTHGRRRFSWNVPYEEGYAGAYKVAGTAQLLGSPAQKRILLYPQGNPGLCVGQTTSDEVTGAFEFTRLARGRYMVVGYDINADTDGAVHTWIDAVPM